MKYYALKQFTDKLLIELSREEVLETIQAGKLPIDIDSHSRSKLNREYVERKGDYLIFLVDGSVLVYNQLKPYTLVTSKADLELSEAEVLLYSGTVNRRYTPKGKFVGWITKSTDTTKEILNSIIQQFSKAGIRVKAEVLVPKMSQIKLVYTPNKKLKIKYL